MIVPLEVSGIALLRGDYATVYLSPDDSKSLTNGAKRIQVSMDGLNIIRLQSRHRYPAAYRRHITDCFLFFIVGNREIDQ